jgi:hypothetical protein
MDEAARYCSLGGEDLAVRRTEWRALSESALVETRERPDGYTALYRGDEQTARALDALVAAERVCCPDIDWRVAWEAGLVRLDVTYPPADQ